MEALRTLTAGLPDAAKDLRLNLTSVLGGGALSERRRYAVALASALAVRRADLADAVREAARAAGPDVLDQALEDDARAAVALMGMNNVYYRFRHMVGKAEYAQLPARLRMNRMAQPKSSKEDFELLSLAVSAIEGCELCVRSHEASLAELGLSVDEVHDAVRIAAVVRGVSQALWIATDSGARVAG